MIEDNECNNSSKLLIWNPDDLLTLTLYFEPDLSSSSLEPLGTPFNSFNLDLLIFNFSSSFRLIYFIVQTIVKSVFLMKIVLTKKSNYIFPFFYTRQVWRVEVNINGEQWRANLGVFSQPAVSLQALLLSPGFHAIIDITCLPS